MNWSQKMAAILAAFYSLGLYANTPENVAEVKKFAAEKGVKVSVDNESEANRSGKKYMVTLERGVVFDFGATSVKGAYYLDQNRLVTFSVSQLEDSANTYDNYEGTIAQGGIRLFTGNSFYVDSTLFYLDSEYRDEYDNYFDSSKPVEVTNFKKLGAHIGIGNQWQWDNFTLGVTWIGTGVQIADLGSTGTDLDEVDRTFYTVLNLQLGVSF